MKKIPLTQGKFALVDDEDYDFLMQWKWHFTKCGGYAVRNEYLINGKKSRNPKLILMHRVIKNTLQGLQTDHIDHDGLNNQKINLRVCTRSENQRNKTSAKGSTSKFLGVSLHRKRNRWIAQMEINNKNKHLGYFKTEEDAALAYNEAAAANYGQFANLNKICLR